MRKKMKLRLTADGQRIAEAKGECIEDFDNLMGDLKKKFGRGKK